MNMLVEELGELALAHTQEDLEKVADGCADLIYLAVGLMLEYNIPVEACVMEVVRSNFTKVWPDGTIHKSATGKAQKPPTYEAPDLRSILYGKRI